MRRKKFLFIIAMVFMLMLSGCGRSSTSEPITTTKFKSIMEENELEVTDKTDSAKDHSYQEIYVAVDEEKYSFEYYFMKNEKSAMISCNDGFRPVSFLIEALEEEAD